MDRVLALTVAWPGNLQPANKNLHDIDALINEHDVPALQALRSLTSAEIALAQRRVADAVEAAQRAVTSQKSVYTIETLALCYSSARMHEPTAQQKHTALTSSKPLSSA